MAPHHESGVNIQITSGCLSHDGKHDYLNIGHRYESIWPDVIYLLSKSVDGKYIISRSC